MAKTETVTRWVTYRGTTRLAQFGNVREAIRSAKTMAMREQQDIAIITERVEMTTYIVVKADGSASQ